MKPATLLLDIMLGDRFLCQMKYTKRGFQKIIDGQVREVHDSRDIERFVFEQRPSLRDKHITILPSNQRAPRQ